MKLFTKLLILIVILGLAGPFVLKGPDGNPIMSADKLMPDLSGLQRQAKDWWFELVRQSENAMSTGEQGEGSTVGKTQVYQWRAADGSIQFSDTPPANQQAKELWIDPNANLVQGLPDKPEPTASAEVEQSQAPQPSAGLSPMTISPSQAKQLMKDAKNIQNLVDQRSKDLENL